MTAVARIDRDRPYHREHEASVAQGMERGKMPRDLPALVAWYIGAVSDELPERLHKDELWHDQVSAGEREGGVRPEGGSLLGTPAWAGSFRALLEGSPSMTDEDGHFRFPVRAALSRMSRRDPDIAKDLFGLAMCGGDHRLLGSSLGIPRHVMEVYMTEALRRLWLCFHEQTVRRVA